MQRWSAFVRCSSASLKRKSLLQGKHPATSREYGLATVQKPSNRPASATLSKDEYTDPARRVLRALLRECTYLPDRQAREYMAEHVLRRFKEYTYMTVPDPETRIKEKLREARQAYGQLKRANEGDRKTLRKVLLMTYGRIGKRRHELMQPLLNRASYATAQPEKKLHDEATPHRDEATDLEEVATRASPTSTYSHNPSAQEVNRGQWEPYAPVLSPPLRALLTSQIENPPPHLTRPLLRRLEPKIPELNSWLRPMPRSRVKNQMKAWYADLLERVHPPLPPAEWERLRMLAAGEAIEPFVQRRRAKQSPTSALETVFLYGKADGRGLIPNKESHDITRRFMRRLHAEVFCQCPTMSWDALTETWTVTWGEPALQRYDVSKGSETDAYCREEKSS